MALARIGCMCAVWWGQMSRQSPLHWTTQAMASTPATVLVALVSVYSITLSASANPFWTSPISVVLVTSVFGGFA